MAGRLDCRKYEHHLVLGLGGLSPMEAPGYGRS